ncbi:SDR family NAD(P)-dependent oxidoreductase [Breznakiella homolactica]|uniref:SDR family oxidoreductase n=1 Tax=Breznakiella homolactica TaxID=2798577 RepID=A0A7T7XNB1_9SPIR|nr:SDR family oxidoreductase [Breznakiella homolactica]QQO09388.1 SDR family oxidoreductase [Breznakiella homolactica]
MYNSEFEGKTIVITGGAGDIGKAVASEFIRRKSRVILIDINGDKLSEAKQALGKEAETYVCDVGSWENVEKTIGEITKKNRIDYLFNNAGIQGEFRKTHEYPPDDFERVIKVNVLGVFYVLKAVSLSMIDNHGGAIVNAASMAGIHGPPNMIAYGASKSAVIGITETAAVDLAPYHIRVNSISPAFMDTKHLWQRQVDLQAEADSQYYDRDPKIVAEQMINAVPMRRCGTLDEISGVVAFLLSNDAGYMTGTNIPIAGGIL